MQKDLVRKWLLPVGLLLAIWLTLKYLLPVLLPFLAGALVAVAAEPAVEFGVRRLHLPRGVASGISVLLTLLLLISLLSLVGALAVKELGRLAYALPDMQEAAQQGMGLIRDWLLELAGRMPDGVASLLTGTALELFDDGSTLLRQVTGRVPGILGATLGRLPGSALGIGTGILAGFMISARLPRLRQMVRSHVPETVRAWWQRTGGSFKSGVGGWLRAQLKLAAVTYGVVTAGFLLLGIAYGPLWAALVALVDAIPVLGTGTVLLPWALVELLRGRQLRALGLVAVYGAALLLRTILEPRLVGKQLGVDPLWTLLALYLGFRFWGLVGMILAPVLTVAVKGQLTVEN